VHDSVELLQDVEARVGIEPTHKGFADLSLTTWVPRLEQEIPALKITVQEIQVKRLPEPSVACQLLLAHPSALTGAGDGI
jgi:hypothetical protein